MIDTVALLLADRSPALRYRALVEVDGASLDDPEVAALRAEVPSSEKVARVVSDAGGGPRAVSYALCRLAYLGAADHPLVDELSERIFASQRDDGSWSPAGLYAGDDRPRRKGKPPPEEGYAWRTLQTAIPLRGLCAVGLSTDPRCERAFEWINDRRLDDGAYPYGLVAGRVKPSGVAGYRRLPRSEGCRATTTGVLACMAHHADRRTSEEARDALDLLLQRETREEATLGFEVARLVGVEPARGFATFYGKFDLAFILDIASRLGASTDDERVADLIDFLESKRGPNGLWDHPVHPHLTRWLTLDILASLRRLESGDWVGSDLHAPFRPYPKRRGRY